MGFFSREVSRVAALYTSRGENEKASAVKRVKAQIDRKLARALFYYRMHLENYEEGSYELLLQPDGSIPAAASEAPSAGKWRFRFDAESVNTNSFEQSLTAVANRAAQVFEWPGQKEGASPIASLVFAAGIAAANPDYRTSNALSILPLVSQKVVQLMYHAASSAHIHPTPTIQHLSTSINALYTEEIQPILLIEGVLGWSGQREAWKRYSIWR